MCHRILPVKKELGYVKCSLSEVLSNKLVVEWILDSFIYVISKSCIMHNIVYNIHSEGLFIMMMAKAQHVWQYF